MPRIINEIDVRAPMEAGGFVSLYHNSGAWGFGRDADVKTIGWLGADDPTIRPEARRLIRHVPEPFAMTLARRLEQMWLSHLPGEAWLSPRSHWHYELQFGNRELLESLLPAIGIDPARLRDRHGNVALAFATGEAGLLTDTVKRLLESLCQSDFQLTFPTHRTICTIHHHGQLWWQTIDGGVAESFVVGW
jgi:hypothetical protein